MFDDMEIDEEVRQILIKNKLAASEKEGVKVSDSGYASSMTECEQEVVANRVLNAGLSTFNPESSSKAMITEGKGTSEGCSKSEPTMLTGC